MKIRGRGIELIAAVLAFLSLIVAAGPAYWTYLCRAQGKFCESSVSAPSSTTNNFDRVIKKISSESGRKSFEGLFVSERGYWPFGRRVDLVARFGDGEEIAIDTFPYETTSVQFFNNNRQHIVAFIHSPLEGEGRTITAYFTSRQLAKRSFDLKCSHYQREKNSSIQIKNFEFVQQKLQMVFDVTSKCANLELNANKDFEIGEYSGLYSVILDYDKMFGATVIVELGETLHILSAYTRRTLLAYEQAQRQLEECKTKFLATKDKIEGELLACFKGQTKDLSSSSKALQIYAWQNGALNLVDENFCRLPYWHKDSGRKTIFSTCDSRRHGEKIKELWLSVHRAQFWSDSRTHFFKGECDHLAMYDFRLADDDRSIEFRLETNCSEIEVEGKKFKTDFSSDTSRLIRMYRLAIDKDNIVVGLAPLPQHTN